MAERNRRNRHTGAKVGATAVVIAALLAGGHFGLGWGRGDGNSPANGNNAPQNQPAATEQVQQTAEPAPTDDGVLSITVREDKILYEGEEVTLAGLEEALLGAFKDGVKVTLTDDHAIKGTYDEVAALLEKLNITAE